MPRFPRLASASPAMPGQFQGLVDWGGGGEERKGGGGRGVVDTSPS